ncbi:hypothetical protein PACTADRAFT_49843 [Pachysolen tannophilus NRRL Y-2460]|uniref:Uncharacterized protein n=1 Tax=Pachysolen tannophilus NRRL Y-2460 TaxID=669874 RepID=A0A1E4TXR4_PACTA|nr:hypothetical protein PACTADRAFT_49843 [Pachysolen tannophilus NRRL Y-2460]
MIYKLQIKNYELRRFIEYENFKTPNKKISHSLLEHLIGEVLIPITINTRKEASTT